MGDWKNLAFFWFKPTIFDAWDTPYNFMTNWVTP